MLLRSLFQFFLLVFLVLVLPSCVGKKKHLEALHSLESSYQNELQSKTRQWTLELEEAQNTITSQNLQLAERRGENNALVAMQDKLEGRIETLKKDLEKQGIQSQSNTQNLSAELSAKDREIERLEGLLTRVGDELQKNLTTLGTVANDVRIALEPFPSEDYKITTSNTGVEVALSEKLLFKSTSTVSSQSSSVLARMAEVLQRFPSMDMIVTGHTDNRPPQNKSYKDNWNVSTIRAAIITRLLVEEHDVSPNQIIAAGKGEFAPAASNETPQGRDSNRRIELRIQPRQEDIIRSVQRILDQK